MPEKFDCRAAFSRNIGWLTEWEQEQLGGKTVAIAGMGGVGGAHLLTLTRLGIGRFRLADLDRFELVNFNRQVGATVSTIGRPKVEIMAQMARDINPALHLETFHEGVDEANLDAFLAGADLFVDGLDFFAMGIRRAIFARCAERGIPAITAAPIGFGTAYIIFMPGRMTFEKLFRMEGLCEARQYVNFATALTPRGLHRTCLADPSRLDLAGRRGPSTGAAVSLCAGVVGAEAVKILLGRGVVKAAPWVHQFDAFRSRWRCSLLPFGNAGPLQSLKRMTGYRMFARISRNARPAEAPMRGPDLARILDAVRWAPSGDNTQPWRFEITGDDSVTVHIASKDDDIYDYNDGQPTLLSAGMLLETMRIAAGECGRSMGWTYLGREGRTHRLSVRMPRGEGGAGGSLFPYLHIRSVDRRPYRLAPLDDELKTQLAAALGDGLDIEWHAGTMARLREVRLNMMATAIRLALPAAWRVHKRVIDWTTEFSRTGIPAGAVGLDRMTLSLMRWAMESWSRMRFLDRYLFGSVLPRIQLDLFPGLFCAAHFSIYRRKAVGTDNAAESILEAGCAIQRFWLTLTKAGLVMQPALAPVIFAHYARDRGASAENGGTSRRSQALNRRLVAGCKGDPDMLLFRGRVGWPKTRLVMARSIRFPVSDLEVQPQSDRTVARGFAPSTEAAEPSTAGAREKVVAEDIAAD